MPDIDTLLKEKRSFKPAPEFSRQANWSKKQVAEYRKAGYELIAISTDNMKELKKSHDKYRKGKFPFPLVSNAKLDVFKKYRCFDDFENSEMHGTFLIDGKGVIRGIWRKVKVPGHVDEVLKAAQEL